MSKEHNCKAIPVQGRRGPEGPRGVDVKGKGKAIPLKAWAGPEGFRRLRLPDFKTIGT